MSHQLVEARKVRWKHDFVGTETPQSLARVLTTAIYNWVRSCINKKLRITLYTLTDYPYNPYQVQQEKYSENRKTNAHDAPNEH